MKPNKIYFPVVDPVTGEYMLLLKNKKESKTNSAKFIKFYFPLINILNQLSTSELILIQYIANNIGINKVKILITKEFVNLKKSTFHDAINRLIKLNVISKTDYQNIYQINKDFIYNGKY